MTMKHMITMKRTRMIGLASILTGVAMLSAAPRAFAAPATQPAATQPSVPPVVGEHAPDFTLRTLDDQPVMLSTLMAEQNVVLVVLRGWPGYQCPICTKQVGDLIRNADAFRALNATVLLVYPGPADGLKEHAADFAQGKGIPDGFTFVIDPAYTFTNAWGLRWNEPGETAYPSTFVIARGGEVRLATISKSHGGRVSSEQILPLLNAKQ